MKPISVIIPSYRNPEYLDLCLKSAFENQVGKNQIIVVLDGFADESAHVIAKYPDLDVVAFDENKGQQIAHNTGVTLAEHEYVLLVNDDNVFPRQWDKSLQGALREYVVAPNQIEPAPSIFKSFVHLDCGKTPETFDYEKFLKFEQNTRETIGERDGWCDMWQYDGQTWPLLMSKKWYQILGGIDIQFPSAAVADWDFFLRCELAGLEFRRYFGAHFYHFAGASTRKIVGWSEGEQRSFEYFEWKWDFVPQLGPYNSKKPTGKLIRGIRF